MTLRAVFAYLGMLSRLGLRRTLGVIRHNASERYHERRLGIDTLGTIQMHALGIDNPGHGEYGPTAFRDFQEMFSRLEIAEGRETLIDYGSGKGRALILAAAYPFRRIIGVEFSAELNGVAQRNLDAARRHFRCRDVATVVADARTFVVPPDVTVAYFNNPFDRPLFEDVLRQLHASVTAHPRRLRVVLNYSPDSELPAALAACNWLQMDRPFGLAEGRWCVIAAGPVA